MFWIPKKSRWFTELEENYYYIEVKALLTFLRKRYHFFRIQLYLRHTYNHFQNRRTSPHIFSPSRIWSRSFFFLLIMTKNRMRDIDRSMINIIILPTHKLLKTYIYIYRVENTSEVVFNLYFIQDIIYILFYLSC